MTQVQQPPDSKRRRAGTKKSRTGCRTCRYVHFRASTRHSLRNRLESNLIRLRHIKCDETPGFCKNCTSTGRTCDYDLQRLPRSGRVTSAKKNVGNHELPLKHHTIPTLLEFFDSPVWQELILQMSLSEPAVYHAVFALSAIHQDLEMYGMLLPGQVLQNEYHRFALDQCGRFREVMLLCCLLFVFTQLLRGQYDDAFKHLQSGLRILHEARAQQHERAVKPCIAVALTNLEIQSLQYGVGICGVSSEPTQLAYPVDDLQAFSSLREIRQKFDSLLRAAYVFLLQCWGSSGEEISFNYGPLHQQQLQLLSQLNLFVQHFESFRFCSKSNRKEQKGADMMRLLCRTLTLPIKTALIRESTILDYYTPEYETHLSMVEDIMDKYPERPTVMPDIGILPTLYFAAMMCRDYTVRHRAIALFQSWPHREGPSDSNWAVFLAHKRLETDSMPLPEWGTTSASSRTSNVTNGRWTGFKYNSIFLEDALSSTECMKNWPCIRHIQNTISS
ncbi:hypothetical protein BDV12DRAFT_209588 [Aspergillus spectabilis]